MNNPLIILKEKFEDIILSLLFFSGALILISSYLGFNSKAQFNTVSHQQSTNSDSNQNEDIHSTNYHLKIAAVNQEIIKQNAELENQKTLLESGDLNGVGIQNKKDVALGLDLDQEEGARAIQKIFDKERADEKRKIGATEKIEMAIAQKQVFADYSTKFEKAFVDKFIDNMEKSGYEVQINENLQVVRVRKIKEPTAIKFD
jgi:hypothetical protein